MSIYQMSITCKITAVSPMRDAKAHPRPPPEGPVRFRVPLMKLAWNQHGRQRLAVALFFSWIGLAVGLIAVLVLLRVPLDALYDYTLSRHSHDLPGIGLVGICDIVQPGTESCARTRWY